MKLLKQLTETPGVPGREHQIRKLIEKQIADHVDEVRTDTMGSLIAVRHPRKSGKRSRPKNPQKVMLAAHMDQIGFLVRYVDDKGFVRVNPVGGFDVRNLFARRMLICGRGGPIAAVMNPAGKPVHMATPDERKNVPEMHEFYLDTGMPADQVKQKVEIGDMVVIDEPLREMGDAVVAQALDDRVGCWVLIEALKKLKDHKCEIHAVFTVQEEVGLRGAGTAAFGVKPDIAIALDTTLCCDTPGVSDDLHINKMGDGVSIKVMDGSHIADLELLESFESVARKKKIKYQRSLLPRGGTDSGAIQRTGAGVRVLTLACPVRYIHTVTEMASRSDIHAYRDLVAAWLAQA
jgi:endoglucanase